MRRLFRRGNVNSIDDGEMESHTIKPGSDIKSKPEDSKSIVIIDNDDTAAETKSPAKSWSWIPIFNSSSSNAETVKDMDKPTFSGKGSDDVIIDAFVNIESEHDSARKILSKSPITVNSNYKPILNKALSCIDRRDYTQLKSIIDEHPEILQYKCKQSKLIKDKVGNLDENVSFGWYGGNLLHILVSQKPITTKKRVKHSKPNYELHITPSVPDAYLASVIKAQPKALLVKDDLGRIPLHCAILSLSTHLKEVNKLYKNRKNKPRIVFKENNGINRLLKYHMKGSYSIDSKGNLPLHYAVSIGLDYFDLSAIECENFGTDVRSCASKTVSILLEANPQSVMKTNKDGNLPVHVICSQGKDINIGILNIILSYQSAYRDMLTVENYNGDQPIFLAVKSKANVDVFNAIAASASRVMTGQSPFSQRDKQNNNILHVALQCQSTDFDVIRLIISLAPFTASTPDSKGMMPMRYAIANNLPEDIIKKMLAADMPIQLGNNTDSKRASVESSSQGLARHVVGRSHHNSWWYILMETGDKYLSMIKTFLSEEATHAQILTLAGHIGPDGATILINCVSDKYREIFHELLRFYDRYEILLASKEADGFLHGVQSYVALDHGLKVKSPLTMLPFSENHISTAVRVRNDDKDDNQVELSVISKEKSLVILRCYQHEEAFYAEIKLREEFEFPNQYFEEMYNYHRHESYTNLALSRAEKLCCITFESPDRTLADVFANVSKASIRSEQWIEKCCIVLKQLATALKFLHNQNFIHGHLVATNIAKYGSIWKLGKLGTVSRIGTQMKGRFRPCVPPESIVLNSSSNQPNSKEKYRQMKNVSAPRVNFSPSVDEVGDDSRDDNTKNRLQLSDSHRDSAFISCFGIRMPKRIRDEQNFPPIAFVPEQCMATTQWDMWGFGLIMVQILMGRCMLLPNFEKADDAIMKNLFKYDESTLKSICEQLERVAGADAADLAMKLLQKNPTRRPKSFEDILDHNYFKAITIDC